MKLFSRGRALLAAGLLMAGIGGAATSVSVAGAAARTTHPGWPSTLVFGEVGEENSSSLLQSIEPLVKLVQQKLGVTITTTAGTSYAAMIEAQQAGKAQIVEYGPFSYVIALNQGLKIENIGIPILAPHTNGGYYSYGVVDPQRTPTITSIKDFAGKKVCFSDPASTSGYLYPSYGLLTAGISPTTGVTPVFAGTDSTTALDVAQGSCQAGFTNNFSLPLVFTQNHVPHSALKIVWTSPEIPGSPVAISDSVPASLRSALENLFVNYANAPYFVKQGWCTSVSQCENVMGQWGFAPPSAANYSQITTICKVTKSPSCKIS